LGDRLDVRLRLTYHPDTRPVAPGSLQVSARALVEMGRPEGPVQDGELQQVTHHYALRLFEMGAHRIAAPAVAFVAAGGDTIWREAAPLEVEIAGVRPEGDEDLRDIKAPLPSVGGVPTWMVALAAGVLAAALAWLLKWFLYRRSRDAAAPPSPPVNYPAEFGRIAAMGLLERGAYKTYYSLLSGVLRHFLEDRFAMEAMERTTAEIDASLVHMESPSPELARRAVAFLAAADLVKFACAVPTLDEARAAATEGEQTVRAVDAELARRRAAAERDEAERAAETGPAARVA